VFGSSVRLTTGSTITADETYLRESIVNPGAHVVEGYQPIMPTFQGLITEEQLNQLMAYMKSLGPGRGAQPEPTAGASTPAPTPAPEPSR
jgi:cytochrome c oxidase subunit 2